MKYFMSVYSPSREGTRNFVMHKDTAIHYYNEWLIKYSDVEKIRRYTNGEKIYPTDARRVLKVWGEDISDQEVFKRRLLGTVDQETLEQ